MRVRKFGDFARIEDRPTSQIDAFKRAKDEFEAG
jgi:hypothetical protein